MLRYYRKLTRELIERSFPLLKGKKILIGMAPLNFYAFSIWLPPFMRLMVFSTKTRRFDKPAIKGLVVHELCHQERYMRIGALKYLGFSVKYVVSRKARAAEEKSTDRLTIEKGFGWELFRLTEITHNDRKNKKTNDLYMSPGEIRSYSENLGKWNAAS
ncbi:MAG TPA: hypothetical protein PKL65_04585 [Bacteroidales bacterium]|nr:hypothetical protein [Bacteroidales bacterium]HNR41487.1 hypothetical protein [Bacteroidales bacterium]HPM17474.1 hypothetical protein [Bacteroidales bacterium]